MAAEIEDGTDAVARVRGNRDALQRARLLAGDERIAHTEPDSGRAAKHDAFGNAALDQVLIADHLARKGKTLRRRLPDWARRLRQRMARKTGGKGQRGLALRDRGAANGFLAAGSQPRGKMRNVAPRILGLDLHRELGERDRAQQVGRQPCNVREPECRRGALDAARDQRNRRPAVLVVRMPRAACQIGRGASAVFERYIGA